MTALSPPNATEEICRLNDALRRTGIGGRTLLTPGIANLAETQRDQVLVAVADFSDFSARNDPYGEHDCAIVHPDSLQVLWKIDCYDLTMSSASPNSADPNVTCRVLTIMLADEY